MHCIRARVLRGQLSLALLIRKGNVPSVYVSHTFISATGGNRANVFGYSRFSHRRHLRTCVQGFEDITPRYVIMRTGCIWSVCGYRLRSGRERWDKDVTSGLASLQEHPYMCTFVHNTCESRAEPYWANSKQSATSPKTSRAPTVTQRTAQNTCWDDGDGWQPRRHMGLIQALMKTTWHKYRTKRVALETRTIPLQRGWHWRKYFIILRGCRG